VARADEWLGAHPGWYLAIRILGTPLAVTYLRLRWSGSRHIPRQGPALLVSNHLSNLDPFMLAAGCPRTLQFMAKRELFDNPLLRFILPRWGVVPLDRARADVEAARIALRLLRAGKMLVIFPEGTRSRDGRLGAFKTGVANIALKMRVPIVPASIVGTDRVLPPGARWPRPRPVRVRYGPAFDLAVFYDAPRTSETLEAATALIRERVATLLPPAMRGMRPPAAG
jgi:1-acyl-sn-glycerol-3-phosphate acyltransferase